MFTDAVFRSLGDDEAIQVYLHLQGLTELNKTKHHYHHHHHHQPKKKKKHEPKKAQSKVKNNNK